MNPAQIIKTAKDQGVYLSTREGDLIYKANTGAMSPELQGLIRDNKRKILRELKQRVDIGFNILDRLLGGGRTTTMDTWREKCRFDGVGELDMWRARLEVESCRLVKFSTDGKIALCNKILQ